MGDFLENLLNKLRQARVLMYFDAAAKRAMRETLFLWCAVASRFQRPYLLRDSSDVVLAVPTFPRRSHNLQSVLYSATRGASHLLSNVVIVLSEEDYADCRTPMELKLPLELGAEILWIKGMQGAVKSVLPVQAKFPSHSVLAIDDDVLYRRGTVSHLIRARNRHGNAIIGRNAKRLYRRGNELSFAFRNRGAGPRTPSEEIYFIKGHGTLYPPNCFDSRVSNDDGIAAVVPLRGADIWFWAAATAAGTRQVALRRRRKMDVPDRRAAPSTEYPGDNGLNQKFQAAIDFFGIRQHLLDVLPDAGDVN